MRTIGAFRPGLAIALMCLFVWPTAADAADRPNVLFVTFDDMNFDSVGISGSRVPDATPNVDKLAEQGLRFEHAHVTIAICQPSRAVWMTGRYPHTSGASGFNEIDPGVPTLPETLRANGYYTGILGKTDHVIPSRSQAFDYRRGSEELADGRSAGLYGDFIAEFFEKVGAASKPFFLVVNADDPHRPFDTLESDSERIARSANAKPARTWKGRQKPAPYPTPSRIYTIQEVVVPGFLPNLGAIRHEIAQYYSSVRRADDVLGVALKALADAGHEDDTIVMLMSDNGMAFPFAKTNVWRHSTHTPWIVRWPGTVEPGSHDTQHMVAAVDFAPTILEALGVEPMAGMNGRSLLPLLEGKTQEDLDHVFTQIDVVANGRPYPMRSVLTTRYGYIWNGWSDGATRFQNESQAGWTMGAMLRAAKKDAKIAARVQHFRYRVPQELYDYQKDPDARKNLISDPAMKDELEALQSRLLQHMQQTQDPQLSAYREALGP